MTVAALAHEINHDIEAFGLRGSDRSDQGSVTLLLKGSDVLPEFLCGRSRIHVGLTRFIDSEKERKK